MTGNGQEAQVLSDEELERERVKLCERLLDLADAGHFSEARKNLIKEAEHCITFLADTIAAQTKTIAVLRERAGWECVCGSANGTVRTHCFNCDAERPTPPAAGGS